MFEEEEARSSSTSGLILLQLALQEDLELDTSCESHRRFILERSEEAIYRVSDVYADVVRNCVNFYFEDEEEDGDVNVVDGGENDLEFRERYYHLIVHPLKQQLDENMKSAS